MQPRLCAGVCMCIFVNLNFPSYINCNSLTLAYIRNVLLEGGSDSTKQFSGLAPEKQYFLVSYSVCKPFFYLLFTLTLTKTLFASRSGENLYFINKGGY